MLLVTYSSFKIKAGVIPTLIVVIQYPVSESVN